ncbi:glycosyltransferase family 4 protein (plasmid) [Rhodobacteraceae bacterium S2214]|nr:glycosyltransferase family 4 protein [Rhodobacteraceae bacterium S2214]
MQGTREDRGSPKVMVVGALASSLVNFRRPLLEELSFRGVDVHVGAAEISKDKDTVETLAEIGVTYHDVPFERAGMNPLSDLRSMVAAYKVMRRIRPDAVIGYTIKPVVFGSLAARLAGVPQRIAMVTGLGFAFTGGESKKRALANKVAKILYWIAFRSVDTVLFQNPDDCAMFRDLKLITAEKNTVLINGSGVDLDYFAETPLPVMPTRFLMIARLLGDKGVREYAEAAATVKNLYPDVEFHLAGGVDPNPDAIGQDEVESWVRGGILVWHDHVDDVRPLLRSCHVYVLPSYREGTPRTVLEAMATGRAIITTDAPGCRETTVDGENGFLVQPKSSNALVKAMTKMLENPIYVTDMGAASLKIVREKFEKGIVARSVVDEIHAVESSVQ